MIVTTTPLRKQRRKRKQKRKQRVHPESKRRKRKHQQRLQQMLSLKRLNIFTRISSNTMPMDRLLWSALGSRNRQRLLHRGRHRCHRNRLHLLLGHRQHRQLHLQDLRLVGQCEAGPTNFKCCSQTSTTQTTCLLSGLSIRHPSYEDKLRLFISVWTDWSTQFLVLLGLLLKSLFLDLLLRALRATSWSDGLLQHSHKRPRRDAFSNRSFSSCHAMLDRLS